MRVISKQYCFLWRNFVKQVIVERSCLILSLNKICAAIFHNVNMVQAAVIAAVCTHANRFVFGITITRMSTQQYSGNPQQAQTTLQWYCRFVVRKQNKEKFWYYSFRENYYLVGFCFINRNLTKLFIWYACKWNELPVLS